MVYPKLSYFFDNKSSSYQLEIKNFYIPKKNFYFNNYKIYIIGNPIVDNNINFNKSFDCIKKLINNDFNNYSILNTLNGEFLFIIENKVTNEIKIINDRFSSIPLYFCIINNKLYTSNNYIDILKIVNFKKKNII